MRGVESLDYIMLCVPEKSFGALVDSHCPWMQR